MDSETSVEGVSVVEPSFASRLFQPGNDRLGSHPIPRFTYSMGRR